MQNNDNKNHHDEEKKTVDELAKEQMTEDVEMKHLPTDGKKPGEIEEFKESVRKNDKNEDKLEDQK